MKEYQEVIALCYHQKEIYIKEMLIFVKLNIKIVVKKVTYLEKYDILKVVKA